ncbi:hypothetical protein Aperf_G00000048804 [Anoplocephala perfoliata]
MPYLKFFRRTWKYAEDEIAIPIIVAGVYFLISPFWGKFSGIQPQAIFITTVVLGLIQIILLIILAVVSSQGGVFDVGKRKNLWIWLLFHAAVLLLEFVFYCVSIWQVNALYRGEKQKATYSEFVSVICWCSILMCAIVLEITDWILHFDINGNLKYRFYMNFLYDGGDIETDDEKRELIKSIREVSNSSWQNFLRNKVVSSHQGEDESLDTAIKAVSAVLVDYLTDLDITLSDLALGLTLLSWQSLQWVGGHSRVPAENVLKQTDPVTTDLAAPLDENMKSPMQKLEKNWLHISRLKRYSHLVNASYGWIWYYTTNPCDCVALNRLCRRLSCRNPPAPDLQIDLENGITGPGGCLCAGRNCYLAAFLEMSQLETSNILVFAINDKFYDASVMLVIDDITEAIVVIVRGTLSGSDTLIDMVAAGEPLRDEDYDLPEEKQFVAHSGMGRTAKNIASRILEDQWIESARQLRPDYPVVITGHSLGAGLVSLMCVFLKPRFPEVKAYAFSPPGGLMNKNLADFTQDFLCSVTYGYDWIGRLESQTVEDLRARIFHALCIYKVPKFKALGKQMCLAIFRNLFCKSNLPTVIELDAETKSKLIDPDMNDAYATSMGSKFKPYLKDRLIGATKVDRLLPSDRSLMQWKNPNCHTLLVLPRPYPQHLYPESLLEPEKQKIYTLDSLMGSMLRPIPSGRLLHIIEVDKDFEIEGVQTYNKGKYVPPPIALWTNAENFNTILVRPKMLFNHSPIYLSTALNRLYDNIMHPEMIYQKIHLNTYYQEVPPILRFERKLTKAEIDRYCRVRKLK